MTMARKLARSIAHSTQSDVATSEAARGVLYLRVAELSHRLP